MGFQNEKKKKRNDDEVCNNKRQKSKIKGAPKYIKYHADNIGSFILSGHDCLLRINHSRADGTRRRRQAMEVGRAHSVWLAGWLTGYTEAI